MKPDRPAYGLDAPNLVRMFFFGGLLLLAVGLALLLFSTGWITAFGYIALSVGAVFTLQALFMVWSSRYGKLQARGGRAWPDRLRGGPSMLRILFAATIALAAAGCAWPLAAGDQAKDALPGEIRRFELPEDEVVYCV